MGILRAATIAVTTTGSNGSATGNAASETFTGAIEAVIVNHHANAPATTDVIVVDTRTNVALFTKANSATDAYFAPRAYAVDSAGANLLSSDANGLWPVPYTVDQGVKVFLTGANVETNHAVVTVLYRK